MDTQSIAGQAMEWLNRHKKDIFTWIPRFIIIALTISLIRIEWAGDSGLTVILGPTSFTIAVLLIVISPLIGGVLLLGGGKVKAAGIELTIESLLTRLVASKETRDELIGILGTEAARATVETDSEVAELGRRVQSALADATLESGIAPRTEKECVALAEEYNQVRAKLKPGTARTRRMTSIQTRMNGATQGQQVSETRVKSWLNSDDPGLRLLGLTFAREQADTAYFNPVLDKIGNSVSAFEQYQALLTMERILAKLDGGQKGKLRKVLEKQRSQGGYLWDNPDRRGISDRILRRMG